MMPWIKEKCAHWFPTLKVYCAVSINFTFVFLIPSFSAFGLERSPLKLLQDELAQLQKASGKIDPVEAQCREARLLYWQAKYLGDEDEKRKLLEKALRLSEKAMSARPQAPEPVMAWIGAQGELALISGKLVALKLLPKLEKAALALKAIDANFLYRGADRILGKLYHLAPGFISIGSDEKAREHLLLAVKAAPEYPGNQLFYAEYLVDKGEYAEAKLRSLQVLNSPLLRRYPIEKSDWIRVAENIIKRSDAGKQK